MKTVHGFKALNITRGFEWWLCQFALYRTVWNEFWRFETWDQIQIIRIIVFNNATEYFNLNSLYFCPIMIPTVRLSAIASIYVVNGIWKFIYVCVINKLLILIHSVAIIIWTFLLCKIWCRWVLCALETKFYSIIRGKTELNYQTQMA